VAAFDGFINGYGEAEVVGRDDELAHAPLLCVAPACTASQADGVYSAKRPLPLRFV
jgi:hypothetical protein